MNYFGHAALAVLKSGSPAFVLGSMLPDLGPMAGIVLPPKFKDERLSAGISFHIQTDALFHQTRMFVELNRDSLATLRGKGVSRGPARASAHMGVEMLIDAQLVQSPLLHDGYMEALRWGTESALDFAPLAPAESNSLKGLFAHLHERGRTVHSVNEERFKLRIGRTLAPRRRLAPTDAELHTIANYLCTLETVSPRVPELMDELRPLFEAPVAD